MIQNQLLKCSYQWLGLKQENKLTLSCQSWLDLAKSSLLARCPRILRHPEVHPHQGEGARGAWEGQD